MKCKYFILILRKGAKFEWSDKCVQAFEHSKRMLFEKCMEVYDPDKLIILATDASPYGVGAV